jgi:hypothetical protein
LNIFLKFQQSLFFLFWTSRVEKKSLGSYDSRLMDIEKVKRYSLIEVSLLAIFTTGLLIAHLIVKHRSTVVLSSGISLPGSGLSVSMPEGPGWDRTNSWQYEEAESSMMLISQYGTPSGSGMAVRCRYVFSTPDGSEPDLLEQKAARINAMIQDVYRVGPECPMVYARMLLRSDPREEVYLGMMRLESNRSVELLVRSFGLGGFHGENVFKTVATSIQYRPGQELADGRILIEEFLSIQSGGGYPRLDAEEAFLIKDAAGKNLGYYHARHAMPNDPRQIPGTQIWQFEYNFQKLRSELRLNPRDKNYHWKTDVRNFRTQGTQVYEISPDENGVLGVTHNAKEVRTFPAGEFFLPDPLLIQLAYVFLQSDRSGVIVDVLNAKCQLVPVYMTKIRLSQLFGWIFCIIRTRMKNCYLTVPKIFWENLSSSPVAGLGFGTLFRPKRCSRSFRKIFRPPATRLSATSD